MSNIKTVCCYIQIEGVNSNTSHAHEVNGEWIYESYEYKLNNMNISHGCCNKCLKKELNNK